MKFSNGYFEDNQSAIYYFYFISWLVAILFFSFKRNNYFTNKYSLLLGAILGFLIPITNGIVSRNWIWNTFAENQFDVLFIDLFWIVIAFFSFIFYAKISPKIKEQSASAKNSIDYKI
ncbi:MAG: hypothetical protein V3U92_14610 [Cellulophaga sp.]